VLPALLLPGVVVLFLATGAVPAIRAPLIQELSRDDERATVASAAGTVDLLGKGASLPFAAWLAGRWPLSVTAAALGAAAAATWALCRAAPVKLRSRG
jgi:hypothetical protein